MTEFNDTERESKVKQENVKAQMRIFPEQSEWVCYMFGNRPNGMGMVYRPNKGKEPNWFVRWMMFVCFDCLWVKDKL